MKDWLKKLKSDTIKYANSGWSPWVLLIVTLADATILPTPTTPFFLTLVFLNTRKAIKYALFATLGTVAGATISYLIGHFACIKTNGEFTGIVRVIFNWFPGFSDSGYEKIHLLFEKWNFRVLFIVSLTSIPYGIFSFAAGAFKINMLIFFISTVISQGIRFLFLALVAPGLRSRLKELTRPLLKINPKSALILTEICIVSFAVIVKSF